MKRKHKNHFFMEMILLCLYGFIFYMIFSNKINIFTYRNWIGNSICGIVLPAITILIILYGFYLPYKKMKKRKRYLNSTLETVDAMSGEEFEEFLKAHFEKMGYEVQLTPGTNDYGIDLICKSRNNSNKDQENGFVVQAKRYKGKVGVAAVQQVIAGTKYYNCKYGMVITNSFFTKNAWELAKKSGITLWDRNVLHEKFKIQ